MCGLSTHRINVFSHHDMGESRLTYRRRHRGEADVDDQGVVPQGKGVLCEAVLRSVLSL